MLFTTKNKDRLNKNCPILHGVEMGTKLQALEKGDIDLYEKITQEIVYDVTTGSASIKIFDANAPFKFEIVDVVIQSRGTDGTGTLKITNGTNDITDAMTCAVDTTMARAATIDDAYSEIDEGETLEIVCAGGTVANVKALVTISILKK